MERPPKDLLDRFPLLETSNLALAQQATSHFWPAHESETIGTENYALAMNRAMLGDVALTFVRCSARIRVTLLEPCREACLILPLAGSVEITTESGTFQAIPEQPLFRAAGWLQRFEATPCRCLLVDLPTACLTPPDAGPSEPPRCLSHTTLAGEPADLLRGQPLTLVRGVNASERVRLIQERAPADRCKLLSSRLRSRELLLLRTLSTALAASHTPQAYLRSVRLGRAREMLLAPGDSLAVADVAETVGYPHLGRFAGYYVERFGELPSDTLTRSRRTAALAIDRADLPPVSTGDLE